MTRRPGSSEEPRSRRWFALMSIGEVTSLLWGSLGQVQEGLSPASVLGPQWKPRAVGTNLPNTSVCEWIVCSPDQRLSIYPALWGSSGEKHKDCFSLVFAHEREVSEH